MKTYQSTIITSLGTYSSTPMSMSQEDYEEGLDGMCRIVADGTYLKFLADTGNIVIISKELLRSCIWEIKEVE